MRRPPTATAQGPLLPRPGRRLSSIRGGPDWAAVRVKPTVSVIMPTRGQGRGLGRAVQSALNQTDVETLLVVVVDGLSPSPTDDAVLASLPEPHRVIRVTPVGSPAALRNLGLSVVRTDLVAFLDDDDWWQPDKLQRQINAMAASRAALVSSNAIRVQDDVEAGLYHRMLPTEIGFESLITTNWIVTSSVLVETSVLRLVGGFPVDDNMRHCDDWPAWLKIAALKRVSVVQEPLVYYAMHSSHSLSSADRLSGAETRRRVVSDFVTATAHWRLRLSRRERKLLASFMQTEDH